MHEVVFKEDTHQYFDESGREYPSVITILKHFGFYNFGNVSQEVLEAAAEFGNNFHALAKLYDEDNLAEYDPTMEPCLNGWKKFLDEVEPKFYLIELPLVSKVWGIAGTADRGTIISRKFGVYDIKTGEEQPANKLQTAGYKILIEENFPNIKIKERGTILVFENGYKLVPHKDPTDEGIFKGLINAYHRKRKDGLL